MKRIITIMLILSIMFFLMTAGNSFAANDVKIGLVAYYSTHDWALDNLRGMRAEAEEQGVELIETMSNQDVLAHAENVESLIGRDVDVIISLLGELDAMRPLANKCADAGIPMIYIDGGLDERGVALNISSDNYEIGRLTGEWLVEELNGEGNIIAMIHPNNSCNYARELGMKDVIKDYPGMKIIEEHDFDFLGAISTAKTLLESAILKYGDDIDAVWGSSDGRVIGAAHALDDAGMTDVKIIGVDGLSEAINLIKSGSSFKATYLQNAELMGRTAIRKAIELAQGQELESSELYIEPIFVNTENAAEIYEELEKARGKSD